MPVGPPGDRRDRWQGVRALRSNRIAASRPAHLSSGGTKQFRSSSRCGGARGVALDLAEFADRFGQRREPHDEGDLPQITVARLIRGRRQQPGRATQAVP